MLERIFIDLLRLVVLVLFVLLSMKLGLLTATIISFIAVFIVPKEVYMAFFGLIELSIAATLMKWMLRFWPVTLIFGLLAWLFGRNGEDAAKPC